jgi:hypothetical protein
MINRDLELIEAAKQLTGGTQHRLAEELGVRPSAISNWVTQGRIPPASRDRLLELMRRPAQGADNPLFDRIHEAVAELSETITEPNVKPPQRLSADAERCGFWAESAWCFNYIIDPGGDVALTDEVWRSWKHMRATRHTIFRHYFRYEPRDQSTASEGATKEEEGDHFGFGFLKGWQTAPWSRGKGADYLTGHVHLNSGVYGSGGYFVRARNSVERCAKDKTPFEFVGFRPECPVHEVHLVLSIPKRLRAPGLLAAFQMATDYPQYYEFAERIVANQGRLDDIVAPWGRDLTSDIKRLSRQRLGSDGELALGEWAAGWPQEGRELVDDLVKKFSHSEDRDVFIVSDRNPAPLATLLLFWPLPKRA